LPFAELQPVEQLHPSGVIEEIHRRRMGASVMQRMRGNRLPGKSNFPAMSNLTSKMMTQKTVGGKPNVLAMYSKMTPKNRRMKHAKPTQKLQMAKIANRLEKDFGDKLDSLVPTAQTAE
jgi:hypothetical protein